jgi:adenylylsulfate kinase-like enzyme
LYEKHTKRRIKDFTGLIALWSAINPDIVVDTTLDTIETSLEIITNWLLENGTDHFSINQ